jgi:hypothetical protein
VVPSLEHAKREAAAADKELKAKAKKKGKGVVLVVGPVPGPSNSSKVAVRKSPCILDPDLRLTRILTPDTRSVTAGEEGSLEDLLDRSDRIVQDVEVRFNELSGKMIEFREIQVSIQKMVRGMI